MDRRTFSKRDGRSGSLDWPSWQASPRNGRSIQAYFFDGPGDMVLEVAACGGSHSADILMREDEANSARGRKKA